MSGSSSVTVTTPVSESVAAFLQRERVRISQSRADSARLRAELAGWRATFQADSRFCDFHGRQLDLLVNTLATAQARIDEILTRLAPLGASPAVFRECRCHDRCLQWIRLVWEYFKPKFEQRQIGHPFYATLAAADELVWACHAEAYERLKMAIPPMPLTYLEPAVSARAIPTDSPPDDLRSLDVPALRKFVQSLPLSTIGLPVSCTDSPWSLGFVAHEVGHQLQHSLDLVGPFYEGLMKSAAPDDVDNWARWSEEIFADSISLIYLGPAATRLLSELELDSPDYEMAGAGYPSLAMRLNWHAQALRDMQYPVEWAISPAISAVLPVVDGSQPVALRLARAAFGNRFTVPNGKTISIRNLGEPSPTSFLPGGQIEQWSRALVRPPIVGVRNKASIRQVFAASVLAWTVTLAEPDDRRRIDRQSQLKFQLQTAVKQLSPEGTRGSSVSPSDVMDWGDRLAEIALRNNHP